METIFCVPLILSIAYFFSTQAASAADNATSPFATLELDQNQYLVTKFDLSEPWIIPQRLSTFDESIEKWKQLVLLGQSDAIHLLSNAKIRELHDSPEITNAVIEAQKERMQQRFAQPQDQVRVEDLYLVIHERNATARLVVSLVWDGGTFYTAYARHNGEWRIMAGTSTPDPVLGLSPKIVAAYSKLDKAIFKSLAIQQLDEVMAKHVDPLLQHE